jgi:hypothetical protein
LFTFKLKYFFIKYLKQPKKGKRSKSTTSPTKSAGSGKKSGKKRARSESPSKSAGNKPPAEPLDILNPIVIRNVYYTTHGATDGLEKLGFKWDGAKKKKKKK